MTQHSPSNPYGQRDEAHQVYGNPAHEQPAYPPGSTEYGAVYGTPTRPPAQPQHQAAPPAVAPTPFRPGKPRRGGSLAAKVAGGIVIGVLALCAGGTALAFMVNGSSPNPPDSPAEAASSPAAPAAKAPAKASPKPPAGAITGEGVFLVPREVKAGTYATTVPAGSVGCYWARLSSPDVNDIIVNDLGYAGDHLKVRVVSSDAALQIKGECGTWTRVQS